MKFCERKRYSIRAGEQPCCSQRIQRTNDGARRGEVEADDRVERALYHWLADGAAEVLARRRAHSGPSLEQFGLTMNHIRRI